jgi:hypothetical protein
MGHQLSALAGAVVIASGVGCAGPAAILIHRACEAW